VPHGIWVHNDNKVFVADRENNRIQIFNIQGDFITEWTGFARPCGFFIDATDTVFVPELDGFISILTITGDLITRFSGPSGAGAHAVWVDKYGDLYINQHLEGQRILKYARC
jgi:DNA-binding beta-propeller fold protein YncE